MQRHWNEIKHVLQYICRTTYMSSFYLKREESHLLGYVDVGYVSNPDKA